jgi:uncharacterized cupin superfamily protein
MAGITTKNFDSPDESRSPANARLDIVDLGTVKAARYTMEPGWRWSESIKPLVGTESCEARHVGTIISGRFHIVHDDGTETDLRPGDAYVIEPGHDAWVVGDEPLRGCEFESKTVETFARDLQA